jgi:hypothetical protein
MPRHDDAIRVADSRKAIGYPIFSAIAPLWD